MDYDSEDNEPLHSLVIICFFPLIFLFANRKNDRFLTSQKPPELILVDTIKDERGELVEENFDDESVPQDHPEDVYYEDKTTDESDYSDDSYESIPKKKAKTKGKFATPPAKEKPLTKPKQPAKSTTSQKASSSLSAAKQQKKTNQTVYTPLAPVPPVLLQPSTATSTITSASNMVEAQLETPDNSAEVKPPVKAEPRQRKKYEKLPKQCTVCGLIVRRLRDHMKGHPDALEFKCQHCNRKYLTQAGLERHTDTQHADR